MQYAGEIIYCRLAPRNLKRSLHALCLVEMTGEGEVGRDDIIRELVKGSVLEREK